MNIDIDQNIWMSATSNEEWHIFINLPFRWLWRAPGPPSHRSSTSVVLWLKILSDNEMIVPIYSYLLPYFNKSRP